MAVRSHRVEVVRQPGRFHARCAECDWSKTDWYWTGGMDLAIADHLRETEAQRG